MDITKQQSFAGLGIMGLGFFGLLVAAQRKRLMWDHGGCGADPASFLQPHGCHLLGWPGVGCTCETPQTFQHMWYVRELGLIKSCIKRAGLALSFIN